MLKNKYFLSTFFYVLLGVFICLCYNKTCRLVYCRRGYIMSGNIFRRVEKKYLLTKEEKDNLFNLIWPYIEEDKYFKSIISNIYFDTVDNDIIINSIDKPIFKEKLRLRSYTVPVDMDSEVFLEIKRKFKGVVGKRRVSLKLKEFYITNVYRFKDLVLKRISLYEKSQYAKPRKKE